VPGTALHACRTHPDLPLTSPSTHRTHLGRVALPPSPMGTPPHPRSQGRPPILVTKKAKIATFSPASSGFSCTASSSGSMRCVPCPPAAPAHRHSPPCPFPPLTSLRSTARSSALTALPPARRLIWWSLCSSRTFPVGQDITFTASFVVSAGTQPARSRAPRVICQPLRRPAQPP